MKATLEPRDDDPEGYVTLTTMLLECWRLKDVQEGDLEGIIEEYKADS